MQTKSNDVTWGNPSILTEKCIACGRCVSICPSLCFRMRDGKPAVEPNGKFGCLACGHCMAICPRGAVSVTGRGITSADAFTLPLPSDRATPEALTGLLQARRSARHYENKSVEKAVIERLLDMSSTAPMGFPPSDVGVVVINDQAQVQELAQDLTVAFRKWRILGTPLGALLLRLMMDKFTAKLLREFVLPLTQEIIAARAEGRDLLFYNAPCVLIFHYPMKDTLDPTIAASFATIAAEALGLGSCMIGTVAPAMQGNQKLKAKWGLPKNCFPSMAMTLGYPAFQFHHGIRRRFASVRYV